MLTHIGKQALDAISASIHLRPRYELAALEADLLHALLTQSADGNGVTKLAGAFFAEAGKLIDTARSAAAVPDFIDPRTAGQRPADFEDTLKFFGALLKLAAQDPADHKLFIEVTSLLKMRSAYRDPELVRRKGSHG
jgi:hypothetical protein